MRAWLRAELAARPWGRGADRDEHTGARPGRRDRLSGRDRSLHRGDGGDFATGAHRSALPRTGDGMLVPVGPCRRLRTRLRGGRARSRDGPVASHQAIVLAGPDRHRFPDARAVCGRRGTAGGHLRGGPALPVRQWVRRRLQRARGPRFVHARLLHGRRVNRRGRAGGDRFARSGLRHPLFALMHTSLL